MNITKTKVKKYSALELTMEFNRLLALADNGKDLKHIKLSDAKKLLYVEEEIKKRMDKLLPGLPKVELSQEENKEPYPNYINVILGHYYERKSKNKMEKIKESGKELRFFVKVKNMTNSTIASIPVMAANKPEALRVARKKAEKFGKNAKVFEVS